jgi:hypothetical protein
MYLGQALIQLQINNNYTTNISTKQLFFLPFKMTLDLKYFVC